MTPKRRAPGAPAHSRAQPAATVLVTAFNEAGRIEAAARSALAQTMGDMELLVVDDGSTDGTRAVLEGLGDPRIRIVAAGRLGRGGALALGMREARAPYVAILDADDLAAPERLERQTRFLDENPRVAWLGCAEARDDRQRGERAVRSYPEGDGEMRAMAARCIPYCHSGVTLRRSIVGEGLNYDPALPYLIDFDLFLRVARAHEVANLPDALVTRVLRDESFFQSRYPRRAQNRRLAAMSAGAVRAFGLPPWHYVFPAARLAYDAVPDRAKRTVRRLAGLKERAPTGAAV